jgi:hypothetical protein
MKTKLTILLLLVLASTIDVKSKTWFSPTSQQQDHLKFEMIMCGTGMLESHQSYKASDGTFLSVSLITFRTAAKARKAFSKQVRVVMRVDEREAQLDKAGKKVGEKVIAIVRGDDGMERTMMLSLEEKSLYTIEAASLGHIRQFESRERSEQAPGVDSP